MSYSNQAMGVMRKRCKEFAESHIEEFCNSFDIEKAHKLLPTKGKAGAQTNSLDKEFVAMLGRLEHIRTV